MSRPALTGLPKNTLGAESPPLPETTHNPLMSRLFRLRRKYRMYLTMKKPPAMRIALPTALSILVTLALLILGTFSAARLRYLRAAPEKKLAMDVDMIKKGIRRQSAEDFADRGLLSDYIARAPEALRPDIQRVFDIYYRVLYGSSSVSAEENELAAGVREQLHAAVKKRLKQK